MWPDRVSNPGPLTYESGALPTALRGFLVSKWLALELFQKVLTSGAGCRSAKRTKNNNLCKSENVLFKLAPVD